MPRGNKAIGCNVSECKHHAKTVPQCSLEHIEVTKQGNTPVKTMQATDCASFETESMI